MRERPPGTQKPRRFVPRFHWELLVCGVAGHELIGTDAAEIRPQDAIVVREGDGLRWYRCVRCDSWLPLEPPEHPARRFPPDRDEIELPYRRDLEFVDLETGQTLPLNAGLARREYTDAMAAFLERWRSRAGAEGFQYSLIVTDTPPARALRQFLLARKR